MTENIFLSYRRDDSRGYTNAIYTMLEYHFDSDQIFMDVDTLVPGSNFVQCLQDAVEACDIFLAIIGLRWENIEDKKGVRRLENPEDFVRIEIAHALKRGIPVIPILVDGAEMPFSENLPDNLKELALHHAFSIGDHMRSDMQRLIKALEKTFERLERERVEQEQKEAERLAKEKAEAERKTREKEEQKAKAQAAADLKAKEEAEKKAREKAEAERKAEEKDEAERIAREEVEAVRIAQEKAEVDRKAKAEADAKQKAQEQAEVDQKTADLKAKKEVELKAKQQAEADFKAKKEAKQKARALAAVEKKEANDKKRTSRQKTKIAEAGKEEKSVSLSPSALKKIPVWAWPATGVIIIAIGYGIFGRFRPTSSEETRETGVSLAVPAITNTPINEAISSIPMPIPAAEPIGGLELSNLMDGAVMVYVPSGEFIMGSDNGETDEVPMHTVFLDGFWIYKTEVTNDLYRFCVEEGTCIMRELQAGSFNDESLKDHPVVNLSWWQADNYCRWAGGGLPTEAEWEKAARGPDGRTYPWGEGIDISLANYDGNNGGTSPVGSYPEGASPYGLLDMAGNVGEFVADWYSTGYYEFSPSANPAGPEIGFERVWRGGSWNSSKDNLRVIERSPKSPEDDGYDFLGFRCVISQLP